MRILTCVLCLSLLPFSAALGSCSSMYYATMEKFGKEKRHILADRVADGRDDQTEAKQRFGDTLEAFKGLTGFEGGKLESAYKQLSGELARCEGVAKRVGNRIDDIDEVAARMFSEWEDENEEYRNADLRARSEVLLSDTKLRYTGLITTMRRVEAKMDPILDSFRDQVRFLKHNLNAQAITSLESTFASIEQDVGALVKDMEHSIEEADAFIKSLQT